MNNQALWFTTRAAGTVSLVLLTAVVALGLLARLRVESAGWPRFLSAGLHRDLSLLTLVFLALHVVTAVVDPFTSLGLTPVLVPFGSDYRRFYLGLGTVALMLMLAVIVTSLARRLIGATAWRGVHWLSYACWPVAVVHGLGTGSDGGASWERTLTAVCVAVIAGLGAWRLVSAPGDPLAEARRTTASTHRAPW